MNSIFPDRWMSVLAMSGAIILIGGAGWVVYSLLWDDSPRVTGDVLGVFDAMGAKRAQFHPGELFLIGRNVCSDETVTTISNSRYHNLTLGRSYLSGNGAFLIEVGCGPLYTPHVLPTYLPAGRYEWEVRLSFPLNQFVNRQIDFPAPTFELLAK